MLLNTLKGFPSPPNPTPTGKCRLDVYECQSWRPDTLSPTRCSAPALLAVTQPLAIEVEIYLLIAWILLDFCLELRVLRVARLPSCMCGSSHTPEHALHKDMRAVKRSIRQEQLEQELEQQRLRLARNFKFPGGF